MLGLRKREVKGESRSRLGERERRGRKPKLKNGSEGELSLGWRQKHALDIRKNTGSAI